MTLSKHVPFVGALVVAAFMLAPASAAAQRGDHTDRRAPSGQQQRSGHAVPRSAQRQQAAPNQSRGPARSEPLAPSRSVRSAPQVQRGAPRVERAPQVQRGAPRVERGPQYAPERQLTPRGRVDRFSAPVRPSESRREFSGGWTTGRRSSAIRPRFEGRAAHRPYYAFRPRLRLGFGIYLGYAVALPTWYSPYLYEQYPVYGQYGGVSFDIQPYDAALYVDGVYMGGVADYGPSEAPLMLAAGRHHIELSARGCEPVSFDLTVLPGQVLPYQGTLPLVDGYANGYGY